MNRVHFSSAADDWHTPPEILGRARDLLGGIDLDPASSTEAQRRVQSTAWCGGDHPDPARRDALTVAWTGRVWLNPPYGDAIGPFVRRLVTSYRAGAVTEALLLIAARTDTNWFQPLFRYSRCYIAGRVKFIPSSALQERRMREGKGKPSSPSFPSVLVYFGPCIDRFRVVFGALGHIEPSTAEPQHKGTTICGVCHEPITQPATGRRRKYCDRCVARLGHRTPAAAARKSTAENARGVSG